MRRKKRINYVIAQTLARSACEMLSFGSSFIGLFSAPKRFLFSVRSKFTLSKSNLPLSRKWPVTFTCMKASGSDFGGMQSGTAKESLAVEVLMGKFPVGRQQLVCSRDFCALDLVASISSSACKRVVDACAGELNDLN